MGKSIRLNLPILDESIPIQGFTLFIVENREEINSYTNFLAKIKDQKIKKE